VISEDESIGPLPSYIADWVVESYCLPEFATGLLSFLALPFLALSVCKPHDPDHFAGLLHRFAVGAKQLHFQLLDFAQQILSFWTEVSLRCEKGKVAFDSEKSQLGFGSRLFRVGCFETVQIVELRFLVKEASTVMHQQFVDLNCFWPSQLPQTAFPLLVELL
jgi:hypothetical protein